MDQRRADAVGRFLGTRRRFIPMLIELDRLMEDRLADLRSPDSDTSPLRDRRSNALDARLASDNRFTRQSPSAFVRNQRREFSPAGERARRARKGR